MSKPTIPKGTRDFSPKVLANRKHILQIIEKIYQSFGFMAIETPAMENLSTLTGKYGNEGDQLLFKILNSGDFLQQTDIQLHNSKSITPLIAEKGLRYDLTVPLARYVVMNQNDISFPFKRYQIQPVWRADRPQKNRYREFWQCDADVLGTNSLICESDFISIYHQVFAHLKIKDYEIRINHRKLLEATVEKADAAHLFKEITIIIDKTDKIGLDGIKKELQDLQLQEHQIEIIFSLLKKHPFSLETIHNIQKELNSPLANEAFDDLKTILKFTGDQPKNVVIDGSLARGLDYYTGCIFEIVPTSVKMGSISGGGRYDNLTAMFGLKGISGIGISFGIDRIYDLMEELNLFPSNIYHFTDLLFCCMEDKGLHYAQELAHELRKNNIKTELYPTSTKLKKQLDYANSKNIVWAAIIGENEMENNSVMLKNLESGEQVLISKNNIFEHISKKAQ